MMWNDPIDSMSSYNRNVALDLAAQGRDFIPNQARNTAFYYTESAVDKFMAENGIRCVIRAHECMPRGFRFHFERTDVSEKIPLSFSVLKFLTLRSLPYSPVRVIAGNLTILRRSWCGNLPSAFKW